MERCWGGKQSRLYLGFVTVPQGPAQIYKRLITWDNYDVINYSGLSKSAAAIYYRDKDFVTWELARFASKGTHTIPVWSGFNARASDKTVPVATIMYLPFIHAPPGVLEWLLVVVLFAPIWGGSLGICSVCWMLCMTLYGSTSLQQSSKGSCSLLVSGYNLRADCQWHTLVPPLNSGANAAPASVLTLM